MPREPDEHRLRRDSQSICVGGTLYDVVGHNRGRRGHASRTQSQGQPELLPQYSRTVGLPSACMCSGNAVTLVEFPIETLCHKILRLVKRTRLVSLTVMLLVGTSVAYSL